MDTLEENNGPFSKAIFSPDKIYRYFLSFKTGIPGKKKIIWIMLNPSTADAFKMDPTVTRCFNRSKQKQANEMIILNLFAMRSPYPKDLYKIDDPIGLLNDEIIASSLQGKDTTLICAWGSHILARERSQQLLMRNKHVSKYCSTHFVYCLGHTKEGAPVHPLHISYDQDLILFDFNK